MEDTNMFNSLYSSNKEYWGCNSCVVQQIILSPNKGPPILNLKFKIRKVSLLRIFIEVWKCVKSLCGTGQPAALGQVLFSAGQAGAINAPRCHLCHLTLTGGILVPVFLLDYTQ